MTEQRTARRRLGRERVRLAASMCCCVAVQIMCIYSFRAMRAVRWCASFQPWNIHAVRTCVDSKDLQASMIRMCASHVRLCVAGAQLSLRKL